MMFGYPYRFESQRFGLQCHLDVLLDKKRVVDLIATLMLKAGCKSDVHEVPRLTKVIDSPEATALFHKTT